MVIDEFGAMQAVEDLGPDDFSRLMKSRLVNKAPSEQASFVIYIRALFTFAFNDEQRLIPEPVLFGLAFRPPKLARRHKGDNEEGRSFRADQIREIISYTDGAIRAMILLGINCGFGNNDCATLTFHNLDLDGGWHSHPRPKTGAERRCPLWAETVAAIRDSIKIRPKPADVSHSDLVFITKYGHPYVRPSDRALKSFAAGRLDHLEWTDGLRATMTYNLKLLGMKRKGLSFYSLRHTFESVGGGAKDQIAVDAIMGHITRGEGTTYRDFIDDKRLRDVTDYVHAWLFPADNSSEKKGP